MGIISGGAEEEEEQEKKEREKMQQRNKTISELNNMLCKIRRKGKKGLTTTTILQTNLVYLLMQVR